jgi:phage repressor protein C with HTH and peptisase S24 domain
MDMVFGRLRSLLGGGVQQPAAQTAQKIALPEGTTQVDVFVQSDPSRRTDQILGAITAASHVVGLDMPDFPKSVSTFSGTGLNKYQNGGVVYNGNNIEATVSLDEPSGLVLLTLQGNSMQHVDALTQKLAEVKLTQPDIYYRAKQ